MDKRFFKEKGSALIVVLGMLSVLMLMAVAFSVMMRIERSGTTNMRHALNAKQALYTALTYAMDDIESSIGDDKVPNWTCDVLSSANNADGYSAETLAKNDSRSDTLLILTSNTAKYLTPSQEALVKIAKPQWRILRSSMATGSDDAGVNQDGAVARFAYVVLNTTGYLDPNMVDVEGCEAYPTKLKLPLDDALQLSSTFKSQRDGAGGFTSFADLRSLNGDVNAAKPPLLYLKNPARGGTFYPDLFGSMVSMSVEGGSTLGNGKIALLSTDGTSASTKLKNSVNDICTAFYSVFTNKVYSSSDNIVGDAFVEFYGANQKITRSHLATMSLLDYMGQMKDFDYSQQFGDNDKSVIRYNHPLDFPTFQDVPLICQVGAYLNLENGDYPIDVGGFYKKEGDEYLSLRSPEEVTMDTDVSVYYKEFKIPIIFYMAGVKLGESTSPVDAVVSGEFKFSGDFGSIKEALNGGGRGATKYVWDYDNTFNDKYFGRNAESVALDESDSAGTLAGSTVCASKVMYIAVLVQAEASSAPVSEGVSIMSDKLTYPDLTKGDPVSALDEDGAPADKWEDVSVLVTFNGKVSAGRNVYQQVPGLNCPEQDSLTVYLPFHYTSPRGRRGLRSERGWAMALDPRFAFDPSFINDGQNYPYWLSNYNIKDDGRGFAVPDTFNAIMTAEAENDENFLATVDDFGGRNKMNGTFYALKVFEDSAALTSIFESCANNDNVPDLVHTYKDSRGSHLFAETDDLFYALRTHYPKDGIIKSLGELGNLTIGPWETISLFETKSFNGKIDCHPVFDYFTLMEPASDGAPLITRGLVNLNAPRLVSYYKDKERAVLTQNLSDAEVASSKWPDGSSAADYINLSGGFNIDPLSTVFYQMSVKGDADKRGEKVSGTEASNDYLLSWEDAQNFAGAIVNKISSTEKGVADSFSVLYNSDVLSYIMDNNDTFKTACDKDRENIMANAIPYLTTRGQSFLILIKADAYSPKFGSDSDGTTLSSSTAVVELWRDTEYARDASGSVIIGDNRKPYHNYHIRSFRILE